MKFYMMGRGLYATINEIYIYLSFYGFYVIWLAYNVIIVLRGDKYLFQKSFDIVRSKMLFQAITLMNPMGIKYLHKEF